MKKNIKEIIRSTIKEEYSYDIYDETNPKETDSDKKLKSGFRDMVKKMDPRGAEERARKARDAGKLKEGDNDISHNNMRLSAERSDKLDNATQELSNDGDGRLKEVLRTYIYPTYTKSSFSPEQYLINYKKMTYHQGQFPLWILWFDEYYMVYEKESNLINDIKVLESLGFRISQTK